MTAQGQALKAYVRNILSKTETSRFRSIQVYLHRGKNANSKLVTAHVTQQAVRVRFLPYLSITTTTTIYAGISTNTTSIKFKYLLFVDNRDVEFIDNPQYTREHVIHRNEQINNLFHIIEDRNAFDNCDCLSTVWFCGFNSGSPRASRSSFLGSRLLILAALFNIFMASSFLPLLKSHLALSFINHTQIPTMMAGLYRMRMQVRQLSTNKANKAIKTSPTTKVILQMADTMTLCLRPTSSTPVNEKIIWIMLKQFSQTFIQRKFYYSFTVWKPNLMKTYLVRMPKDTILLQNQLPRSALRYRPSSLEKMLWTCRR